MAAPTVTSISISAIGTFLGVNCSENMGAGYTGFTLTVDGIERALALSSIWGNSIGFNMDTVYDGQTCLVSYTPGDVVGGAGLPLAAFTDSAVTNQSTVDSPGPLVTTIDTSQAGIWVGVTFDDSMGAGYTGFTLTVDGEERALLSHITWGTSIGFFITKIYQGQTCLMSYTPGDIVDHDGGALEAFSNHAVVNNSLKIDPDTQTGVLLRGLLGGHRKVSRRSFVKRNRRRGSKGF